MLSQSPNERLSGVVERVTFHNPNNGWSVIKVAPFQQPNQLVTVLVHQAKVFAGASMEFHGKWKNHPQYGEQFQALNVTEKKPASAAALEKYLGSGLIKGVGPKTAKRIVKHFKDRTLTVFESSMDELLGVPGIATKKLKHIKSSWDEHKAIRDVMMFLQSHGVSTLFAVKIFKNYGGKAIEVVSHNPYRLSRDIFGIGFFSADKIAKALGIPADSPKRVQAAIKHVLQASRDEGHCYLTKEQIVEKVSALLELSQEDLILSCLKVIVAQGEVKERSLPKNSGDDQECFYANSLFRDENYVAQWVRKKTALSIGIDEERIVTWLKRFGDKSTIQLSDEQSASVVGIVQSPFSILTGGPGCGKTTTTKTLVKLLTAMGKNVILAAPTGRAAQRMEEVIGQEAKTIHRLLEWAPEKGGFKKDEEEPLDADFVLIDETSMLDINLAASLLRAIPEKCQTLFIGDPDQLPSVGAGDVLKDLLHTKGISHFRLTKIFRQGESSSIISHAHQMNQGDIPKIVSPIAAPSSWQQSDCLFIDSEQATTEQLQFLKKAKRAISKTIEEGTSHELHSEGKAIGALLKDANSVKVDRLHFPESDEASGPTLVIPKKFQKVDLEKLAKSSNSLDEIKQVIRSVHPWSTLHHGFTALETITRLYTKTLREKFGSSFEIQILSPQVRGSLGTANLNQLIQQAANPATSEKKEVKVGERLYRVGDRVIQTRNNYDLKVYNGDIGKITAMDHESNTFEVSFSLGKSQRTIIYSREDLSELSLAYAITIHKSQGSEFDCVLIPLSTQHFKMLFRNLIYTGLTRAKKLALFVGTRKALALTVKSVDHRHRQTALSYLIEQG